MSADFFDSNVFVYLFDETDDRKFQTSQNLIATALAEESATISFQVVQETLNVLTRGLTVPVHPSDIHGALERFLIPLWSVMPSANLYGRALAVRERYGYSFYDSLIIAAALEAGCDRLLSEDLHHGQEIEGLRIENPFLA